MLAFPRWVAGPGVAPIAAHLNVNLAKRPTMASLAAPFWRKPAAAAGASTHTAVVAAAAVLWEV